MYEVQEAKKLAPSGESPVEVLSRIISPLSTEEFLERHWGRRFAHIEGVRGRFTELYSWDRLNEALGLCRLQAPRLRLCRDGQIVNPKLYQYASQLRGNGMIARSDALMDELAKGATIVIEEVEDTFIPLRNLVVSLEDMFRAHVHANLYASWHTDNCFPVHWDPHDVLVLQIFGRKRWKVWTPTCGWRITTQPAIR